MGTGEIQVFGIAMSFRHRGLTERNVSPVETYACHMRLLDALPAAESMQPIFQFVMMPGQDKEADEEACESAVAELRPAQFVDDDRCQQSDSKNCKPPTGEPFAEPSTPCIQAVDSAEYPNKTGLSSWYILGCDSWLHRNLTILIV